MIDEVWNVLPFDGRVLVVWNAGGKIGHFEAPTDRLTDLPLDPVRRVTVCLPTDARSGDLLDVLGARQRTATFELTRCDLPGTTAEEREVWAEILRPREFYEAAKLAISRRVSPGDDSGDDDGDDAPMPAKPRRKHVRTREAPRQYRPMSV